MHSFVGQSSIRELCPPALGLEKERTEGRKREKFYIYLNVTHTQMCGTTGHMHRKGMTKITPEPLLDAASGAGRANLVIAWESHGVVLDPHSRQCSTNASASFHSTNASECFETLAW